MDNNQDENLDTNSLENPGAVADPAEPTTPATAGSSEPQASDGSLEPAVAEAESESSSLESESSPTGSQPAAPTSKPKRGLGGRMQSLISHVNIYLLLFILIIVLSGGIIFVGFQRNKKEAAPPVVTTTPLTQETIDQLKGTETKVGDPKQLLSIESNTVFSGKVLLRDSLDVAGTIRVGGALSLPGITVSGTSNFDQIQANRLAIAGDTNIQGQLTVQRNLTVTGGASFGGPISAPALNVESLQLSGDLRINRHIDTGGSTPGRSNGNALGSGGTSSINGTDTAGTITINTGGSPPVGCFVTVNFAQSFNATPHVVVTPVGSAAANLRYYINRSASSFSLCSTTSASAGTSFSFDYIALD